jgi:hypothetical protein
MDLARHSGGAAGFLPLCAESRAPQEQIGQCER